MAYSGIKIKPSKVGSLHKLLGVPQKDKLTPGDTTDKPGDTTAVKKKKVFARNSRKWNKKPALSKLMGK